MAAEVLSHNGDDDDENEDENDNIQNDSNYGNEPSWKLDATTAFYLVDDCLSGAMVEGDSGGDRKISNTFTF